MYFTDDKEVEINKLLLGIEKSGGRLIYYYTIHQIGDKEENGFHVKFPDVPVFHSVGCSEDSPIPDAKKKLEDIFNAYLNSGTPIPFPFTKKREDTYPVELDATLAKRIVKSWKPADIKKKKR